MKVKALAVQFWTFHRSRPSWTFQHSEMQGDTYQIVRQMLHYSLSERIPKLATNLFAQQHFNSL
jgi:hypothetical protein